MNRALFLDRDGTMIEDSGYIRDPALVRILPGVAATLAKLQSSGWKLIVISNQSGVGRGLISAEEASAVHQRFLDLMKESGVEFAGSFFCTHAPQEGCQCRKPSPLLIRKAAAEHSIELGQSWMIGDRADDIVCGRNIGCRTIWLKNQRFPVAADLPDFIADDWDAIAAILRNAAG